MSATRTGTKTLSRRLALALPLAAAGCSFFEDNLIDPPKPKLPGKRVALRRTGRELVVDNPRHVQVRVPAPSLRAAWNQAGGTATHEFGHPATAASVQQAWRADIGTGSSYRAKIPAAPVTDESRIFTIDSDGLVRAFDIQSGQRVWEFDTTPPDNDNVNIGGGIAVDGGILYVSTGRAEALALEAASGALKWRAPLSTAARSAPTVADGQVSIALLGNVVVSLAASDGHRLWSYQGSDSATALLGLPAPAYASGLLVAGFGSGELVCLRARTGAVVWIDSLASGLTGTEKGGLSAVHGMPVIQDGRVFATGLGGLMLSLDLRSGRRLWERDIASAETACLAGDWLFVLSTDSELAAISRLDGSVIWVTQLQKFQNEQDSTDPITWFGPLLAGGRLLLVSNAGTSVAVDPSSGEKLGQQDLAGPAALAPIAAQNSVFVVTEDATLLALR